MPKLLIVDDHKQIASILEDYARKEGYETVTSADGDDALRQFGRENPDLILLDVMMPGRDGFSVCREIRKNSNVPIIMVTARGEDFEKIMGLEIGADDYIVKPFSPGEVLARVRAVLRRIESKEENSSKQILQFEGLVISLDDYTVTIDGEKVSLTKKEIDILWTLASNKNRVFTRDNLLDSLWGYDYVGDTRTVDSHIKRLRAKLDGYAHDGWNIATMRGVGYKFEVTAHV